MDELIHLEAQYCAQNYLPLPVVLTRGQGVYVWDSQGKQYMDMMSAYSAVSHGHCHPRLVQCMQQQAAQLGVVSRAFYSDKLAPFLQRACELTRMDRALPMNTGAEAVETALKAARKWAYDIKGVPEDQAEIIVCRGNFHGRTIAIVAMSDEAQYRQGFGPFPAGFRTVPFGDLSALQAAINENTAAFLVEPIQGEGGIILPPAGYLKAAAELCAQHKVLLICDEVQVGLGRTGRFLASDWEAVQPQGLILGKALGGGLLPVSLFLANKEVMDVFSPGDHGSTFGGYPLAAAVALEALNIIVEEDLVNRAQSMGDYFLSALKAIDHPAIVEVRGKGLLLGVEFHTQQIKPRELCEELAKLGVLSKETHETVVRFAPPLVISKEQIDWAVAQFEQALANCTS